MKKFKNLILALITLLSYNVANATVSASAKVGKVGNDDSFRSFLEDGSLIWLFVIIFIIIVAVLYMRLQRRNTEIFVENVRNTLETAREMESAKQQKKSSNVSYEPDWKEQG